MEKFRRLLRKDVLTICGMIFIADVVSGIVAPTFSLFAQDLGASLALIGTIGAVMGLTRMVASVPIGLWSDTRSRKQTLSTGMLLFALATFLFSITPNPVLLIPFRVIYGLGQIATFLIGVAYVGDIVSREERGMALGLYTTAMGLGFAVGPILGGLVADRYGFDASYQMATVISLIGFLIAVFGLSDRPKAERSTVQKSAQVSFFTKIRILGTNPNLLAASIGQMLISGVVFSGTISNFYPVYVSSLSISEATIGIMFAIRAVVSTAARMPTGVLTTYISSRRLMLIALVIALISVSAMSFVQTPWLLTVLLAGEGIAFGMFLTAGQTFVTENADETDRGTAIGIYGTAGAMGATFGPLLLGVVAEIWGVSVVFWLTGVLVLAGIGLLQLITEPKPVEAVE